MNDEEAEQWAFEVFAELHPHEANKLDPERFWTFFKIKRPNISRERMNEILSETDEPTFVTARRGGHQSNKPKNENKK